MPRISDLRRLHNLCESADMQRRSGSNMRRRGHVPRNGNVLGRGDMPKPTDLSTEHADIAWVTDVRGHRHVLQCTNVLRSANVHRFAHVLYHLRLHMQRSHLRHDGNLSGGCDLRGLAHMLRRDDVRGEPDMRGDIDLSGLHDLCGFLHVR